MADFKIKPAAGTGNKLILQTEDATDVLTTSDSGVAITAPTIADLSNVTGTLPVGVTGGSGLDAITGANEPYFSVTLGANHEITNTTHTKVNFDTELIDSNSKYNTTDKRFTPTVAGWYHFGAYAIIADLSSSAYYYIRLYKNGASVARAQDGGHASDWHGPFMSTVQYSDTNDYFEAYCFHNHGGNRLLYHAGLGSPATEGYGFFGYKLN